MEEDNVAMPGSSTSDISPTPCKRARKNVLHPTKPTKVTDLILLLATSLTEFTVTEFTVNRSSTKRRRKQNRVEMVEIPKKKD